MGTISDLADRDAYAWENITEEGIYWSSPAEEIAIHGWDRTGNHFAWAGNWNDAEGRIYPKDRDWKAKVRFPYPEGTVERMINSFGFNVSLPSISEIVNPYEENSDINHERAKGILEEVDAELDREYQSKINEKDDTYLKPGMCTEGCERKAKKGVALGSAVLGGLSGMIGGILTAGPVVLPSMILSSGGMVLYDMTNDYVLSETLEEYINHPVKKKNQLSDARSNLYNEVGENNKHFFEDLNSLPVLRRDGAERLKESIDRQREQMFEAEFLQFEDRKGVTLETSTDSYEEAVEFVSSATGHSIEQEEEKSLYDDGGLISQILIGLASFDYRWKEEKFATEVVDRSDEEVIDFVESYFPEAIGNARSKVGIEA